MTLTTLAEKMIRNQPFTANTGRDYRGYYDRAIRPTLGDVNVKDLDDTRVLNWLKEVIANQPASQVMPITTLMRKLLDMAVRRRHMSTHPLQKRPLREILSELGFERRARSGSRTYFHATFQAPDGGHISFWRFRKWSGSRAWRSVSCVASPFPVPPLRKGREVGSSLRRPAHAHVCCAGPYGPHVFDLPWPLLRKEGPGEARRASRRGWKSFSYPRETRKRPFIKVDSASIRHGTWNRPMWIKKRTSCTFG